MRNGLKVYFIGNEYNENDKKEVDTMNGITVKYCVDGFNGFAFHVKALAENFAKVAENCHFYEICHNYLYDCKNAWDENDYYDNPIQAAIKACHVFYIPNEECFTIIKKASLNEELFNANVPFVAGWYFYNYLVETEKFNDDCFLPLKGNEKLFAKQYNPEVLNDLSRIIKN